MLRPTRSRDGRHRPTINIRYRLSSVEVAIALVDASEEQLARDLAKAEASQMVRDFYQHRGWQGIEFWDERYPEEEVPERVRWAAAQVRRLWPDLDDDLLEEFEGSAA